MLDSRPSLAPGPALKSFHSREEDRRCVFP